MNCSGYDSTTTLYKVHDYFRVVCSLLCTFFLILCTLAMLKLARERLSLYILVSKLCPTALLLLIRFINNITLTKLFSITIDSQFNNIYLMKTIAYCLLCLRFHILALALNRAHALFFPFHYAQNVTKKIIFVQCAFVYGLCIIVFFFDIDNDLISTWIFLVASPSLYVAVAIRLAWIKYCNSNWLSAQNASSSDGDSVRITVLCIGTQIYALFFAWVSGVLANYDWFKKFLNCDDHPIGQQLVFYPYYMITILYYVSDELLLTGLCKDMRVTFGQIIRKMVFSWKRNGATTQPAQQNLTQYSSQVVQKVNVHTVSGGGGGGHNSRRTLFGAQQLRVSG